MPVRLKDVAARAGVSVKTVSNVVNGYVHVSGDTRARVQAVLDEMGYRPNVTARNLRAGRVGVIALAVPELDNPYFAELAGHVMEAAEEHGWTVLVDQTDGRAERERDVLAGFRHHLIDGLIMSPFALTAEELAAPADHTVPVVLLGEKVWDGPADHVAIDNVAAARAATEHLLALGRRRVALVGHQVDGPGGDSGVARLRRRGWELALAEAGLQPDEALVGVVGDFGRSHGYAAMAALLDGGARPDAVFCFNDTLALGVLRALVDRGLAVPEDVAVIGVDDVEETRWSVPRLSSVAPDKRAIARTAVAMLAERIGPEGRRPAPRDVRAGFAVVARESTVGAAEGHPHGPGGVSGGTR
ncbi:LacI family DNA-binding transcriptional regulator [Nocardioides sp. zg-579]|uniref:LacI family DNA-binding transcriptional regulator n=1 Tax=Nocardioides marmotae TaxID=2663857 RepID=A0A6I3J9Y8_9ACTN|nr:LacI family DNA-binding transcriptional regulator [Nocardioides marmotae]MCR6031421.1 LacI family DNA-binding transcriptional regulator [Gordonia jinghuaiqii]MTB95060.1 LacI family DNA-binding transcriptional regulator [Nocardioides marmotae]QKE02443.1 LacI family DNA-binding transcriptional regulator [Nocardioides marmotae]